MMKRRVLDDFRGSHHAPPLYLELKQVDVADNHRARARGAPIPPQQLEPKHAGFSTGGMTDCTSVVVISHADQGAKMYGKHGGGSIAAVDVEAITAKLAEDGDQGPIDLIIIPGPDNYKREYKNPAVPLPQSGTNAEDAQAVLNGLEHAPIQDFLQQFQSQVGDRPVNVNISLTARQGLALIAPDGQVTPSNPFADLRVDRLTTIEDIGSRASQLKYASPAPTSKGCSIM
ncbi:MAG TPA: hypothetical protein VD994_10430 [Prosthecobacter sp.]|nr:hypothetical protein [Prosthecobacter sp.]